MNKKGFTLIELLAVIVILAIIALIATPMIMGVIDKAKKGAVEASANGYIDAVEKYSVYGMLDGTTLDAGVYTVESDTLKGVEIKGEKPATGGWVAIDTDGQVVAASLKFSSYSKYVGYTIADRAKATLDANVTVAEDATVADAVSAVSTALKA